MDLDIQLTSQAIQELCPAPAPAAATVGAWVEFRGIVRAEESGRTIAALEYEAYSPMAEKEMRRILNDLCVSHSCLAAKVIHRVGVIPAGEAAIYVGIAARHRKAAFGLLDEFMDRLKEDVPIWKCRALNLEELEEFRKQ